jgi:predicted dehydrogenase
MADMKTVALVGCGGMGRQHLEVLRGLAGFEVIGVCDVLDENLQRVAREYGIASWYTDFEEMYDALKPELVSVATQTRGHCAPSVAALKRGISVLCEKPIAIDLAEADEMVAAAAASGAKFAINQQNHLNPSIVRGRQMVEAGVIGDLVLVRGRNKCGRKSGNEFTEMGTHVTDMMLCFGGVPEWCSGTIYEGGRPVIVGDIMEAKQMSPGDRDSGLVAGSVAMGHYGFAGGGLGEIHFLGYQARDNSNFGVDVLGSEGQLAIRAAGDIQQGLWHLPRPMEGMPSDYGDWEAVDLGERANDNPIASMYQSVAAAIEQDTDPPGSGVEGRWAFEMVLGLYQSHREGGRRIDLPLSERRHPLEAWRAESP